MPQVNLVITVDGFLSCFACKVNMSKFTKGRRKKWNLANHSIDLALSFTLTPMNGLKFQSVLH